jgi:hypothetical protein
MISQALERALISGKGRLVTHMHAIGQVGKIEVPKHNFIIIHQVTLYPFLASPSLDPDVDALDRSILNVYEFSNQDQSIRNAFMVRNSPAFYQHSQNRRYVINSQPVQFETYMVFDEDVYLQIGNYPGVNGTNDVNYGALNADSQVPPTPGGYYGDPNVLQSIVYGDNVYKPAGTDAPDPLFTPSPSSVYSTQPYPTYGNGASGSLLPAPDYNSNNPVANIQYVVLNEVMRKDFQ